jgi:hypothetical protein
LHGQPDLQIVEGRGGMGLRSSARRLVVTSPLSRRRRVARSGDGFFGDGRALRSVDVDELAPDMGHAGDLADGAGA